MIRIFIILIFFFSAHIARADEESDKAEFKRLYAEFNDLYTNSKEIDVIIKSATNLKEMASRIFKKRSKEYAETIYILAALYDKKGDAINSDYERKAFELYDQYFNVYKKLKLPINQTYLERYLAFVDTEYNIQLVRSKTKLSQNAIKLAQDIGLPDTSIADIELDMAIKRYKINDTRYAKILLNSALNRYKHEYSKQHYKEGEILLWLGLVEAKKFNPGEASKNYMSSIEIFDQFDPYELELHNNTHATLVDLYEKLGRSDIATYHCKAIAVEQIENFDPYVNPLYIKIPENPSDTSEGNTSGSVLLEFSINEDCNAEDIKVKESTNKIYVKNSIEALSSARFTPKTKNGQLVKIKGFLLPFTFHKIKRK